MSLMMQQFVVIHNVEKVIEMAFFILWTVFYLLNLNSGSSCIFDMRNRKLNAKFSSLVYYDVLVFSSNGTSYGHMKSNFHY
jgi:hypothetical protein